MHAIFQKVTIMNAVLAAPRRAPSAALRRAGLVDRLALRVGLALVVWGRRPQRAERYVTPAELAELDRMNAARYHPVSMRPLV